MGGKSSDPNKAAMRQQKEQMARLDKLSLPELEEYMLQNPDLVGLLDAEQLGKSAQEEISLDPQMREKQMQALQSLQTQADEGLTATDKYAMEQMLGDVASQEQSRQKQIENQMAQRGMDSSGAALMAKMQGSQDSANNARAKAMQMAAQGQGNRQQALQALGQQAGQMEQADYGRKANLASARDTIASFNAQNRQNVNQMNLAARQGIENQRAGIANQQAQVGNQIAQQNYNNQVTKVTGQGNVANSMSNIAGNTPAAPSAFQSALGGAGTGASIGGSVGGPVGAGYGAAIGAGAGLVGSMFEDGGIARSEGGVPVNEKALMDEQKQKAAFKKKYMKQIHDEMLGGVPQRAEDGKVIYAANGRDPYMTDSDPMEGVEGIYRAGDFENNAQVQRILSTPKKEEMRQPQEGHDALLKKEGDKKTKGLTQGLGALQKLMASPEKEKLELGDFSMGTPQNVMTPLQAQQFANPFSAEDGAIINSLVDPSELPERGGSDFASPDDRKSAMMAALLQQMEGMNPQEIPMDRELPQYKCGGVHYASDGMGDIVDSGMESYAGDRVDAKINDGEAILNVPQQQRMMDLLRGKIDLTELGDDDIVEGVPREYRDELHEEIEEPKDQKMKGLEKLIELLGK